MVFCITVVCLGAEKSQGLQILMKTGIQMWKKKTLQCKLTVKLFSLTQYRCQILWVCEGNNTVSLHAIKQRTATEAWEHVCSTMLKAVVESNTMPADQCCINCSNCAIICCVQCAPWAFYCQKCFGVAHSRINIFHTGQVWEVLKTHKFWLLYCL